MLQTGSPKRVRQENLLHSSGREENLVGACGWNLRICILVQIKVSGKKNPATLFPVTAPAPCIWQITRAQTVSTWSAEVTGFPQAGLSFQAFHCCGRLCFPSELWGFFLLRSVTSIGVGAAGASHRSLAPRPAGAPWHLSLVRPLVTRSQVSPLYDP